MLLFQRVVYPAFGDVAREAFPAYYAAFTARIPIAVVAPEFLALLSALPLFWLRSDALPSWSVWAALGFGILYMAITFGLHLPIHATLGRGDNSPAVVAALTRTNLLRTIVQLVKCALIGWMLTRR